MELCFCEQIEPPLGGNPKQGGPRIAGSDLLNNISSWRRGTKAPEFKDEVIRTKLYDGDLVVRLGSWGRGGWGVDMPLRP